MRRDHSTRRAARARLIAFATAAGSALVSPVALKAHDWAAITARAREFVAAAKF